MKRRASSQFQRVALAIAGGFLALHLGSSLYYGHDRMVERASTFAQLVAERAVSLERSTRRNPELVELVQSDYFRVEQRAEPSPIPERAWPHNDEVRGDVVRHLEALGFGRAEEVRFWFSGRARPPRLILEIPAQGGWLRVEARTDATRWGHSVLGVFWTSAMVLVIFLAVLWATRRVTRHLPGFALAADSIGRSQRLALLPEDRGPAEIREASRVMNDMQRRVLAFLEERANMLAALSHDLRTYVTRLQLRLESIDDPQMRTQAEADVRAMTDLLDESMAYARDAASEEEYGELDLASLLQSIVDAERDAGMCAVYAGPDRLTVSGQRIALTRAFTNLVGNAIRYGQRADVHLSSTATGAQVEIRDGGPGIAPADQAQALKPYVRLEPSRSRHTGGSGLGLAIAANVIARHQGELSFRGGAGDFRVVVRLPMQSG